MPTCTLPVNNGMLFLLVGLPSASISSSDGGSFCLWLCNFLSDSLSSSSYSILNLDSSSSSGLGSTIGHAFAVSLTLALHSSTSSTAKSIKCNV